MTIDMQARVLLSLEILQICRNFQGSSQDAGQNSGHEGVQMSSADNGGARVGHLQALHKALATFSCKWLSWLSCRNRSFLDQASCDRG